MNSSTLDNVPVHQEIFIEALATPPATINLMHTMFELPSPPLVAPVPTNLHRPRPRQHQNTSAAAEIDAEASPNWRALFVILSKYFTSYPLCRSIVNRLDSLALNESITLSEILRMATTRTRPTQESKAELIMELRESLLFECINLKRNGILIKKGSRYNI